MEDIIKESTNGECKNNIDITLQAINDVDNGINLSKPYENIDDLMTDLNT